MRRALALVLIVPLIAGCAGSLQQPAQRPELQRVLNSLVEGSGRIAPGAAAYVAGPRGVWEGAAGTADVSRRIPMRARTRSRLGSVSKLWTAAVVVRLAQERKLHLDDTVEHWLPGVFPYGDRITIRELLDHTSGMVDDNDIQNRPRHWLAKIHDRPLRHRLLAFARASRKNPAITVSPAFEMQVAAALPLLFTPGSSFHYSNIGYKTAAAIAEKAGRAPLGVLYRRIIIAPLKLSSAHYDPAAAIAGPHAVGYVVQAGGVPQANSGAGEGGVAASGGIVSNARDEARFLLALVRGRIVSKPYLRQMETPALDSYALGTGVSRLCGQRILTHGGATASYMAEVAVTGNGSRVAVLLVNGRTYNSWGDAVAVQALDRLFCHA